MPFSTILISAVAVCMAAVLVYSLVLMRRRNRAEAPARGSHLAIHAKKRFVVGVACMLVFGPLDLLGLLLVFSEEEDMEFSLLLLIFLFFSFFYTVGVWYALNTARRRAEPGEALRYTPLVGPVKTYAWDEIAYATQAPSLIRGYDVNHLPLFRVDNCVLGFTRLSDALLKYGVPVKCPEASGAVLRKRLLALLGRGEKRDSAAQNPLFERVPSGKKLACDHETQKLRAFGSADVKIFLPGRVPIYEMIRASVNDAGELPDEFCLPRSHPDAGHLIPGALDGMRLYHMPPPGEEETQQLCDELMELVVEACGTGETEALVRFLHTHPFVLLADPLIDRLRGGWRGVPPGQRFFSARHWVETSADAKLVKLGIALLNGVNIERDEECRQMLATLALCDEFTLYAQVACSLWDDTNDTIFEFARRTYGWGKIFMVTRLHPATEEICDWIARRGCENRVDNRYLGHACIAKLNMPYYLREADMDAALFRGLGIILEACLAKDGPLVKRGIEVVAEQADEILLAWLEHAKTWCTCFHSLCVVTAIRDWNEEEPGEETTEQQALEQPATGQEAAPENSGEKKPPRAPNGQIAAACEEVLNGRDWAAQAAAVLEAEWREPGGHLEQALCACRAAGKLGFTLFEPLFALMEKDPVKYCIFAPFLFGETEWCLKVIELYESELPLEEIATGMGSEDGVGPAYETHRCLSFVLHGLALVPLTGTALVEAGLGSPVTGNRAAALTVLELWNAQLGGALVQAAPELAAFAEDVCGQEVDDALKKRFEALLDG